MTQFEQKFIHIIGIGNLTRQDDGVAIRVLQQLAEEKEQYPGIKITDLGIGGVDIAFMLDGWQFGIIIDAIHNESLIPGEIIEFTLEEEQLPEIKGFSSTHGFDVLSALKLAYVLREFQLPEKIFVIGIQVETFSGFGLELSPRVAKSVPKVIEKVKKIIFDLTQQS
ncbi:MAG: hydrogenase maturation protease [Candidatus Heimdallarchaeota archaeon]